MSARNKSVQTLPQPGAAAAPAALELKSVGKGKFVATYHRNAYRHPLGPQRREG